MKTITLSELFDSILDPGLRSAWIDVRSELEYERAALPGTQNLPLLTQAERQQIGIAYKYEGQAAAMALGEALVGPHLEERIAQWVEAIQASPARSGIIMCWRGGLRSQISCSRLEAAGQEVRQVEGGYKAVRQRLLAHLDEPPELIVLQGLTGSGKSELLRTLPKLAIDLEAAAVHRGSAFGALIERGQPSQASFENELAFQIVRGLRTGRELLVEDESRLLGRCFVPEHLLVKMRQAPVVIVEESRELRVKRIFTEYLKGAVHPGASRTRLREQAFAALRQIERRLDKYAGPIRAAMIDAFRSNGDEELHYVWISGLLEHYYDKRYHFSSARHPRKVLFKGDFAACRSWLTDHQERAR